MNFWNRHQLSNRKSVTIEAAESCTSDSIFFAPEGKIISATNFVRCDTDSASDLLVRCDDPFEISVVGMSVSCEDFSSKIYDKVIMFSTRKDPGAKSGEAVAKGTLPDGERDPAADDVLYIHYDPMSDRNDAKMEPDVFLHVPSSKSLYMSSDGRVQPGKQELEHSVNCRFNVMEINEIGDSLARAVDGIDESDGGIEGQRDEAMPFLPLVTSVFSIVSAMGSRGLRKYSKPDHIIKTDFTFLLADSKRQGSKGNERSKSTGEYLRYGYYFFLSRPVDGKLYAHTGSSSQHVPLKLRRTDKLSGDEQEYFPLTGVSYIVMRVCRKSKGWRKVARKEAVHEEHAKRVGNLTRMSSAVEVMAKMASANRKTMTSRKTC